MHWEHQDCFEQQMHILILSILQVLIRDIGVQAAEYEQPNPFPYKVEK